MIGTNAIQMFENLAIIFSGFYLCCNYFLLTFKTKSTDIGWYFKLSLTCRRGLLKYEWILANYCTSEFLFLAPLTPINGLQRPKLEIMGTKVALWHIIGTHIKWWTSFLSCLAQLKEDGGANLVSHLLWHPNYFFSRG